jgi:pyruvate-formate lyase-activating enzyme
MVPIRIRPALAVFPGVAVFPATIPVQGCSLSCRRCLCRDKENRVISGVEMAELNAVA